MRKKFQVLQVSIVMTMVLIACISLSLFTRNYIKELMTNQIIADNQAVGEQIARLLQHQHFSSWPKEEQRKYLQSLCETVKLPNGGFICATASSGELLAMPGLRRGENRSLADMSILTARTNTSIKFKDLPVGEQTAGLLKRDDMLDIIATFTIEGTKNRLLVHQSYDQLEEKLSSLTYPINIAGVVLVVLLGTITYKMSSSIIHGYENKLESNNKLLRTVNEELRTTSLQRELYYEGFSNSASAIILTDHEGTILHTNKAFTDLYGYEEKEVCGKTPHLLNPGKDIYLDLGYDDELYDSLFKTIWNAITNPEIGFWEGELPNKTKDDSIIWSHLIINAMKDEHDTITHYIGVEYNITKQRDEELQIRLEIYDTINQIAEMRDNETGRHLIRVSRYCRLLAEELRMPKKFCDDIERFSPLHDIGKVGIPDEILLAPRQLTDEEFRIIKCHPYYGYQILCGKETMEMGAEIAYSHHEKFDGTGYPRGLKGTDIPISARIVAIADVYDALRSRRPYKEPWIHQKVLDVIVKNSGEHFDPEIVEAFIKLESQFEVISIELQDTEEDVQKLSTPSVAQAKSLLSIDSQ